MRGYGNSVSGLATVEDAYRLPDDDQDELASSKHSTFEQHQEFFSDMYCPVCLKELDSGIYCSDRCRREDEQRSSPAVMAAKARRGKRGDPEYERFLQDVPVQDLRALGILKSSPLASASGNATADHHKRSPLGRPHHPSSASSYSHRGGYSQGHETSSQSSLSPLSAPSFDGGEDSIPPAMLDAVPFSQPYHQESQYGAHERARRREPSASVSSTNRPGPYGPAPNMLYGHGRSTNGGNSPLVRPSSGSHRSSRRAYSSHIDGMTGPEMMFHGTSSSSTSKRKNSASVLSGLLDDPRQVLKEEQARHERRMMQRSDSGSKSQGGVEGEIASPLSTLTIGRSHGLGGAGARAGMGMRSAPPSAYSSPSLDPYASSSSSAYAYAPPSAYHARTGSGPAGEDQQRRRKANRRSMPLTRNISDEEKERPNMRVVGPSGGGSGIRRIVSHPDPDPVARELYHPSMQTQTRTRSSSTVLTRHDTQDQSSVPTASSSSHHTARPVLSSSTRRSIGGIGELFTNRMVTPVSATVSTSHTSARGSRRERPSRRNDLEEEEQELLRSTALTSSSLASAMSELDLDLEARRALPASTSYRRQMTHQQQQQQQLQGREERGGGGPEAEEGRGRGRKKLVRHSSEADGEGEEEYARQYQAEDQRMRKRDSTLRRPTAGTVTGTAAGGGAGAVVPTFASSSSSGSSDEHEHERERGRGRTSGLVPTRDQYAYGHGRSPVPANGKVNASASSAAAAFSSWERGRPQGRRTERERERDGQGESPERGRARTRSRARF